MKQQLLALLTAGPRSVDDRWPLLQRVRWRFVLLNLVAVAISPINLGQLSREPGAHLGAYALATLGFATWAVVLYRRGGRGVLVNWGGPALVLAIGVAAGHYGWAFGTMYMGLFLHSLYGGRNRALGTAGLYLGAYELALFLTVGPAEFTIDQVLSNGLAAGVMSWVMVELSVSLRNTDESGRRERILAIASRRLLQATDGAAVAQAAVEGVAELVADNSSAVGQISLWRQEREELALTASYGAAPTTRRVLFRAVAEELVADYRSSVPIRLTPATVASVQRGLGLPVETAHGLALPLTDSEGSTGLLFVRTADSLPDDVLVGLQRFADEVSLADRAVRRNQLLAAVLGNSADGIVLVDHERELVFVSPAVAELAGRDVPVGAPLGSLLVVSPNGRPLTDLADMADNADALAVRRADDSLVEVEVSSRPVAGEGTVLNLRDVTRQRRLQEEISYRAFHDQITALPNRARFLDRLEDALADATKSQRRVAVALLDLDNFKAINDARGHLAGDKVLCHVADRVGGRVRATDTFARLGGDEFALLLDRLDDDIDVTAVLEDILLQLREPFVVDGHEIAVSASCGVVVSRGEHTAEEMLGNADVAMYAAKDAGKDAIVLFDIELRALVDERRELRGDLELGIARDELRLHYQPVLALETGLPVGVEALVRWQHPTRGLLAPNRFIPIAESSGLINALGRWVMLTAFCELAGWLATGAIDETFQLHVNLSARQLADPGLVGDIEAGLELFGIKTAQLVLEITETALTENPELAEHTLRQLRRLGIGIAIDDFGTGYASFTYLRRFPVGVVKIDRSFVSDVSTGPEEAALARAIVRLAQSLGMTTVAEGIETEDTRELLESWGCDHGQGWLWSKALPAAELMDWLGSHAGSRSVGAAAT